MQTKVFCILSDERVYRSRSPAMFNRVLERVGLKGVYVPFCVRPEHLGQALQSLRYLNISGANVTVPYKEKVMPYLDVLSEGANIIGATNTIVRNGDQLKGYNTNAIGIMEALDDAGFQVAGKTAVVFGAGGAARTVVFILNWLRIGLVAVIGRNAGQAREITQHFGGQTMTLDDLLTDPMVVDVIINATPVSSPGEDPEFFERIATLKCPGCQLVMDLNYGREDNCWQTLAHRANAAFTDGLTPLAFQARRTFALWTGLQVAPQEFVKALQ